MTAQMTAQVTGARRAPCVVLGVGLVAFLAMVALLIPWKPYEGGPLELPAASSIFTGAELSAMESYSSFARFWSRTGLLLSLAVACVVGFSAWGRRAMELVRGPWWLRVVQGVVLFHLVVSIATAVPDILIQRRRGDAGLSTQEWTGFVADRLTNLAVSTVGTLIVVMVVIGCARRWQRRWPLVAGPALAGLVLLGSFVYPVLVQPLFMNVTSLTQGPLRTEVFALADAQTVPLDDIYVADASRRTTTLNAHVAGFGSTRRVVLYDTLVEGVPREETLAVVAHELAHAEHEDVLVGSLMGAAGALVGVGLLGLVTGRPVCTTRVTRASRPGLGNPTSVPLVLALLAIGGVLAVPVQNTVSRQIELRADVIALESTNDLAVFVDLQRSLATRSLADPSPAAWSQFWFGSHPTVLQRIALAERVLG